MHLLQNGEFVGDGIVQIPLLEDQQVAVALHAAQESVVALRPGGDGLVEAGVEVGGGGLGEVFGQFLKVVDEDDGNNGSGADILVPDQVQVRQVREVQCRQHGLAGVVGPDGGAEDAVAAAVDAHIAGVLPLAGNQPVHLEFGHQVGDLLLVELVPEAAEIHKAVVGPDQRAVAHAHQGHGEGRLAAVGVAQGVGGGLDEGLQLPAPLELAVLVVAVEHAGDDQLCQSQSSRSGDHGCRGKNQHHDKKQIHSRLQQPSKLAIHRPTSLSRVFLPIVIHSTLHYSILKGIKQQFYISLFDRME